MGPHAGDMHKDRAKLEEQSTGEQDKRDVFLYPDRRNKTESMYSHMLCKQQPVRLCVQTACDAFSV